MEAARYPGNRGPDSLPGTLDGQLFLWEGHSISMMWESSVPSLLLPLVLEAWMGLCFGFPIYRMGIILLYGFCFVFKGLGVEPRAMYMLGKSCNTEPYPGFCFVFETPSWCVAPAGFKLAIFLPHPPKAWDGL